MSKTQWYISEENTVDITFRNDSCMCLIQKIKSRKENTYRLRGSYYSTFKEAENKAWKIHKVQLNAAIRLVEKYKN